MNQLNELEEQSIHNFEDTQDNKQNNQYSNNQIKSKKKKSNNWSSAEEEKLAEAWLHISQQPEFGTNQSGEVFFLRVTDYLNSISPFEKRDVNSVKIRWASLKTATLKFSSIYAQIEREPPSGTVETDWPDLAIKIYDEMNPRYHFKSLPAWRILSTAPKWITPRPPPGPLAMAIASIPSSDAASESSNPSTPRATSPERPIGTKKSKRKRIDDAKAEEVEKTRQEQIKRSNDLAELRLKAIQEGNEVAKDMAKADAEAKASLVQVNELKVLMMSEENCHTPVAKEVLKMMQQRLKEKYQTQDEPSSLSI